MKGFQKDSVSLSDQIYTLTKYFIMIGYQAHTMGVWQRGHQIVGPKACGIEQGIGWGQNCPQMVKDFVNLFIYYFFFME